MRRRAVTSCPTKLEKAFVLEYQQKLCNWCKVLLGDAKECDHIIPKRQRMLCVVYNLQYLCCNCHGLKNRLESKKEYFLHVLRCDFQWLREYLVCEIHCEDSVLPCGTQTNSVNSVHSNVSSIISSLTDPTAFVKQRQADMKVFANSTNYPLKFDKIKFLHD